MAKCARKCEIYSRVTGYMRPTAQWNRGKQQEFMDRKMYATGQDDKNVGLGDDKLEKAG